MREGGAVGATLAQGGSADEHPPSRLGLEIARQSWSKVCRGARGPSAGAGAPEGWAQPRSSSCTPVGFDAVGRAVGAKARVGRHLHCFPMNRCNADRATARVDWGGCRGWDRPSCLHPHREGRVACARPASFRKRPAALSMDYCRLLWSVAASKIPAAHLDRADSHYRWALEAGYYLDLGFRCFLAAFASSVLRNRGQLRGLHGCQGRRVHSPWLSPTHNILQTHIYSHAMFIQH